MSRATSTQPRKQRRAGFQASVFGRHRRMSVSLSRELRARYGRRALPLRKGDTVRVISGSFKGREERVSEVDLRQLRVTLDNVTIKKVDQKLKRLPIGPTHLILTRLNLSDPWRRAILKVTAAETPPAEPGEPAPAEAAPTPTAASEEPAAASDPEPSPAPPKKRRTRATKEEKP